MAGRVVVAGHNEASLRRQQSMLLENAPLVAAVDLNALIPSTN
jgi:hypothetical protein